MKTRTISAVGVAIVGLVPAFIGGLTFALVFAVVMALAYRELLRLVWSNTTLAREWGMLLVVLAALAAWYRPNGELLPAVLALGLLLPLIVIVRRTFDNVDVHDWATVIGCTTYAVLPTYAAVALRNVDDVVENTAWADFVERLPGDGRTAAGLGWFLLALLVTWISDTAAYLVGRSIGRTKLAPFVSPNKTVEGAVAGLVAAALTTVACSELFGLPMHPLTATVLGLGLGVLGQIGDLAESKIKRRAHVKDSGNAIPGHGGFLDRVDALVFVLVATWAVASVIA